MKRWRNQKKMKIKLKTQGGLFSSSKTIVIEANNIEHIVDDEDGATITMKDETRYEVKESAEAIYNQIEGKQEAPPAPAKEKKE